MWSSPVHLSSQCPKNLGFLTRLQWKAKGAEECYSTPPLKKVLKAAFCFLLSFLVVSLCPHLPALPHIHKQNLHLQFFWFVPGLRLRKFYPKHNKKSQFEGSQSLFFFMNLHQYTTKKSPSIWSRGKPSPCIYRGACSRCVYWPQTQQSLLDTHVRARRPLWVQRPPNPAHQLKVHSLAVPSLAQDWLNPLSAPSAPKAATDGAGTSKTQFTPTTQAPEQGPGPHHTGGHLPASLLRHRPHRENKAETVAVGAKPPPVHVALPAGCDPGPASATPSNYPYIQERLLCLREGSGGESMMRNKDL